jgi:Helix-turn-helix domain
MPRAHLRDWRAAIERLSRIIVLFVPSYADIPAPVRGMSSTVSGSEEPRIGQNATNGERPETTGKIESAITQFGVYGVYGIGLCRKIVEIRKIVRGSGMAHQDNSEERGDSPVGELAYGLRNLRSRSGLKVAQLQRESGFSSTTLYDAFSGKQLPSQQVTLAIVAACGGDVDAWRLYWAQVRGALDPHAPEGSATAIVPPWAASAAQPENLQTHGRDDSAEIAEPEIATPYRSQVRHVISSKRRPSWLLAIGGMVVVAGVSATVTGLAVAHPGTRRSVLAIVIVQNKVAIGSSKLLEDTTPAYLSRRPVPFCSRAGCEIKGTDMHSGAPLPVSCWVRGAEMTNENTQSPGIARNPHGATSSRWYRGIWPNGKRGYLSEVYIEPRYRGGLGLPRCTH